MSECESCGSAETGLVAVHRVYVVPASEDTPERVTVVAGTEQWCFPCRTHYPHEEAAGEG